MKPVSTRKVKQRPRMQEIHSWDEVPAFQNEDEEHEFWSTHSLGEEILEQMGPIPEGVLPPPRASTSPTAVRFDRDILRRLKALAAKKGKGYQTLLKEFVVERLYEEEKRERLREG